MTTRTRTLIVGAGQAGLALSRCLTHMDHEHVVLERGRVAERWRSERWDSFSLLTPNWQTRLPCFAYDGAEPDGFMDGTDVIDFFERYAESFRPPVRTGVTVRAIDPAPRGWFADTSAGGFEAANVVVATGYYDKPIVPPLTSGLPAATLQLHTGDYRNLDQLPAGAVLVVGAGPSGQQIADELALAGRHVYLAVGRHRPLPRRYRGKDVYWWLDRMRMLDRTIDSLQDPSATNSAPSVVLAGGDYDLNLHRLVEHGVVPLGRLEHIDGRVARFANDLPLRLAEAGANVDRLRAAVDSYIKENGIEAPADDNRPPAPTTWTHRAPTTIDLAAKKVTTIIWATGYGRDYSWINAPVFDADGEPRQRRGVTAAAGLYFLGLRWMYRRKSNFIDGVGDDAAYLAEHIIETGRDYVPAVIPDCQARSTAWRRLSTPRRARIAAT